MAATDPIKHVVVLMLENHSFDHMLGALQGELDLDGIDRQQSPRTNEVNGKSYEQLPRAARILANDPKHEHPDALAQIKLDPDGHPGGFVADYAHAYPACQEVWGEVMKYHDVDTLPALHALARQFTVCDRWFSSLPGPTWPNRFFVHSGTSLGRVTMPEGLFNLHLHWYNQTTLYDRLNDAKVSWKIYHGDIPQSLILVHQLLPQNVKNYHPLRQFYADAAGDPDSFPAYAFIEPEYTSPGENDDHPPHDILNGDRLIANVYNALRHNEKLWMSTLFVVLWDEHGGFYDHVPPPITVAPDHYLQEYTFAQYGPRVPALLISPWTPRGTCHEIFDHTSILRYAIDKWRLAPLGNRTANAKSIAIALQPNASPLVAPAEIYVTASASPAVPYSSQELNANQRGLAAYSQ